MSLRYCFESDHVKATFARSKPTDLAVIDSDGISKTVCRQLLRLTAGAITQRCYGYYTISHIESSYMLAIKL